MAVIKQKHQRVGVFIDVQNMYYSARKLYGRRVHFGNIVEDAVADRELIRSIAYVVRAGAPDEQSFFDALVNLGIETKERDLQVFYDGAKKGDWDVGIVVDAIRLSPKLDVVVLVSGDGDFIPLIEYLKNAGVQTEVMAFGETTSAKLIEHVDAFTNMSETPSKYIIGYRGKQRPPNTSKRKTVAKKTSTKKPVGKKPTTKKKDDIDPNLADLLI